MRYYHTLVLYNIRCILIMQHSHMHSHSHIDMHTMLHSYNSYTFACILQKVLHEILPADGASTVRGVDSLEQDICDKDREIRRLTSLCEAKEKEVEQGGSGCEERIDWARGELSDMRAKLEEAEDRKMRAEEKLKTLQTRVMERESQMVDIRKGTHIYLQMNAANTLSSYTQLCVITLCAHVQYIIILIIDDLLW